MSTVVRCPNGSIKLYTKGADTVILERLGKNQPFTETTLAHLEVHPFYPCFTSTVHIYIRNNRTMQRRDCARYALPTAISRKRNMHSGKRSTTRQQQLSMDEETHWMRPLSSLRRISCCLVLPLLRISCRTVSLIPSIRCKWLASRCVSVPPERMLYTILTRRCFHPTGLGSHGRQTGNSYQHRDVMSIDLRVDEFGESMIGCPRCCV